MSFEHESQLKIIQGSYEKIYVGHSPNGYNRYYRSGGFRGLANLTTFDASNCSQIESIEPSAFYHCSKLQSVKVGTMIPPTCGIDAFSELTYIIHSGFISGYQNRYGDNLKPPTNVYHRMTA